MTKSKDLEYIKDLMENMKENGKKINKMDKERKFGMIIIIMKASTKMVLNMAKENIHFLMEVSMKESGLPI